MLAGGGAAVRTLARPPRLRTLPGTSHRLGLGERVRKPLRVRCELLQRLQGEALPAVPAQQLAPRHLPAHAEERRRPGDLPF